MVKNPVRALSWGAAVVRSLCTAASAASATVEATKVKPLYRRLSELGSAPDGSVVKTMNKWQREGRRVRAINIIKYVKELRKYKRFKHALELMKWMDMRGMNMSYSNHAIRLDLISKVEGTDSAEKYFSSLSEPAKNELTYGALLHCYCTERMEDKATALFEKMKQLKYDSTLPYNNLMSLYMRLGQPDMVPALVQEMTAKNIFPNDFTYCVLMNSFASLKDIGAVERVIEEIKERDVAKLKWPIYSNLASIYISAGLIEKAESALKMLENAIDRRDRTSFHFLVSLYAGTGNLTEVNRVWNSLKAAFPKTINMSYLIMLQSLDRLDNLDALKQCFQEWESSCATYDIRLANILIGAYLRRDMIGEADSILENAIGKGSEPNFRTLEMFSDHYSKNHKMDLALKYMEDAVSKVKNQDWKPDKQKVEVFLRYFEEQKDVDGAEAFCKSLKKLNCLDSDAYGFLLRTYLSAGKAEPSLQQRIKEDRIEINSETEKLLRRVCCTEW